MKAYVNASESFSVNSVAGWVSMFSRTRRNGLPRAFETNEFLTYILLITVANVLLN